MLTLRKKCTVDLHKEHLKRYTRRLIQKLFLDYSLDAQVEIL